MKCTVPIVVALFVSACLVFASGGTGESTATGGDELDPQGTYPIARQPATFSAVTIYSPGVSSGKLAGNKLDVYLQKLTNVKVIWKDVIDSNVATERIRLLLASGDMPDAIMAPYDISVQQEFADLQNTLACATGVVPAWSTEFIIGARSINDDGDWRAFVAELKRAGCDRYETIWSDTVKRAGY